MSKLFIFLTFLICCRICAMEPEDPYSIGAAPDWILKHAIEPSQQVSQTEDNIHYILADYQTHVDLGISYYHLAKRLLNSTAVQQDSSLKLEFDPTYQTVILHDLTIHRQGQRIDKMGSARMELIQQEKDIERYQYNGRKTLIIFIDDIHAGDVIEYSYSISGEHPLFKGRFQKGFYLQFSLPIEKGILRLVASRDRHLNVKGFNTADIPQTYSVEGNQQEWSWQIVNDAKKESDSNLPEWFIDVPAIQVSEFNNWNEVAQWGEELYRLPEHYSSQMDALVKKWQMQSENIEEQALLALRFVQNDIRYLGLELGENTHKPTDPSLVLQRRYGDCKDKSQLLRALLSLMGIQSVPFLVSSTHCAHIEDWHPSTRVFDHVILQIEWDGRLIFVDPTLSLQGGRLLTNECPPYQKGLALTSQATQLSTIPLCVGPQKLVCMTYEMSASDKPITLSMTITYKGRRADQMRNSYQENGLKAFEKHFYHYFSKKYGVVEKIEPFQMIDHLENNELVIKGSYEIADVWEMDKKKERKSITITASHIYADLDMDIEADRTEPLNLTYPYHVVEEIFLIRNDGQWQIDDEQKTFENDEMMLSYVEKPDLNVNHIRYEFKTKNDHIPVDKLAENRQFLKEANDVLSFVYYLSLNRPKVSPLEEKPLQPQDIFQYAIIGLVAGCQLTIMLLLILNAYPRRGV